VSETDSPTTPDPDAAIAVTPHRKMSAILKLALLGALVAAAMVAFAVLSWEGAGPATKDTLVYIESGASVSSAATQMAKQNVIGSAKKFKLLVRIFGSGKSIKPGEYKIPRGASMSRILNLLQAGDVLLRRITISEGMSAIQVQERFAADPMMNGSVDLPAEGTVLPETYTYTRGEPKQAVLDRAQAAMSKVLEEAWAKRQPDLPLSSPQDAIILASIVEKETSRKSELAKVAGVYINRLRMGMKLQADPTVIYPVTQGKPLRRRILRSELDDVNDYNTYAMAGLPKGPIAMPGRKTIEAVLNPDKTSALFFVADGSGGHAFSTTVEEHNRNVANWRKYRASNGI
jgi:UPF0755 protein